jgi:hypothetical protein
MVLVTMLLVRVATWPVSTRQGFNYEVSVYEIPLYVKVFEFVDRSAHYSMLAREITQGASTDQERALALFGWTRRNVRETPDGWPVVDDHIWHVIIRGHGVNDQMADVFTTLATYAGVPSFWHIVKPAGVSDGLVLSFARVDRRWVVFDVANGLTFMDAGGKLAPVEDLVGTRELVRASAGSLNVGDTPYERYFMDLRLPEIPQPLRAELQMPIARLWHEVRSGVGLGDGDASER